MKLLAPVTIAALFAAARPVAADASRPVADQLAAAAARDALADLSELKHGVDMSGAGFTLQEAVAELGHAGDLDDLRALVRSADATKPQLNSFFLVAYAHLGDRAQVDAIVAKVDAHKGQLGKEGPAWACSIAMAYEVLGDDNSADARLGEAHPDCAGYLADEDVATGHPARALAILDATAPPVDALAQAMRAEQRARVHAKDARTAIADAADRLERDKPLAYASELMELGSAAAKAGWKSDARALLGRAITATAADDEVTRDAIIGGADEIDHTRAVALVKDAYGTIAADASAYELVEAATAWARVGDRARAKKLLAQAIRVNADPKRPSARAIDDPPPPPDDPRDAPAAPAAPATAAPTPLNGPMVAWLYVELGQLDLAITAVAQPDFRRPETLLELSRYAREHAVTPTKKIRAALAQL